MTATVAAWKRRATAPMITTLATVLIGCTVPTDSHVTESGSPPAPPSAAADVRMVLRFGDHVATATLADTPESQQLATMLPATVDLKDVWAQAKSGRLPLTITVEEGAPVHDPVTGGIYFWPSTEVIAIYYADTGQAVPAPGLIRLGTIDTGLDNLAAAGRRITVRIDQTAAVSP